MTTDGADSFRAAHDPRAIATKPTVRPGWTIALTGTAFFMTVLDGLAVTTALPTIHRDLGANLSELQWTLSAYMLAWAAVITTAAACGDRFGRRRLFGLGLCIFALASACCALSTSAGMLIAARTDALSSWLT